jgi:hypothetical protein
MPKPIQFKLQGDKMNVISELINDAIFILQRRKKLMPIQKKLDLEAPKVGDLAPDFTLISSSGTESITLPISGSETGSIGLWKLHLTALCQGDRASPGNLQTVSP